MSLAAALLLNIALDLAIVGVLAYVLHAPFRSGRAASRVTPIAAPAEESTRLAA
jgi:hypothetical protein